MKRLLSILILIVLIVAAWFNRGWFRDQWDDWTRAPTPVAVNRADIQANANVAANTNTTNVNAIVPTPEPEALPPEFNLSVPFTTQAPLVNWDHAHDEACEEAAALIVNAYWRDQTFPDKAATDAKLLAIEAWETERFGYYESTTIEETVVVLKEYFKLTDVDIISNPTIEQLKRFIFKGKPVMVPSAGRLLGNPNFRSPGPVFHYLVLKGYATDTFITNDPGTRKGADYVYSTETIMNAMHDWNGGDVENGRPAVIVVNGG